MLVEELKGAMWNNALVRYQGGLYEISAAIYKFDRKEQQFYYRLELKDTKANSSLIYCRLEEAELTNMQGGDLMNSIGELIDRSQIGRSEVARLCGVSYNTVYKWCKGLRRPKPIHLKKLSKLLNVKMSELFKIVYGD